MCGGCSSEQPFFFSGAGQSCVIDPHICMIILSCDRSQPLSMKNRTLVNSPRLENRLRELDEEFARKKHALEIEYARTKHIPLSDVTNFMLPQLTDAAPAPQLAFVTGEPVPPCCSFARQSIHPLISRYPISPLKMVV